MNIKINALVISLLVLSTLHAYAQIAKKHSPKIVSVGYYDRYEKLPKLRFDIITENEFAKYKINIRKIQAVKTNRKGDYFFIKTKHQTHRFKIYKDYGGTESWSGSEFLGYYPTLKLYAITSNSTAEHLGFGSLMLLDSLTDYTYNIISFGDESVQLPVPSPNNKYLVYFSNAMYQHKNTDIGILKINNKSKPTTYLKEYASYHSNDFAIETIIWINDNSFMVKGYEEIYVKEKWIKKYKYYKTSFGVD